MNKDILQQYADACALLDETKEDLRQLKEDAKRVLNDSVKGSNPEFPYQPMSFHVSGIGVTIYNDSEKIRQTEQLLEERKRKLSELKLQVEYFINEAPPRIGRVIRLRYLKRKTWEQVAAYTGYGSPDAARIALDRFLENKC